MSSLVAMVVRLSLAGGVTCLVLLAVSALVRNKLRKAWVYRLWLIVTVSFLVPVPLNLRLPVPQVRLPAAQASAYVAEDHTSRIDDGNAAPAFRDPAPMQAPGNEQEPVQPKGAPGNGIDAYLILAVAWLAGAGGMFLWYITGYCLTAGKLKKERILLVPERVPVYESAKITTPLLVGLFRPVIYLPKDFKTPGLAVRHELCHWRRGDIWSKWIVQLVVCIHWFNPMAHLMKRELNRLSELSCDEAVIRDMDGEERQAYGQMLLDTLRLSSDFGGPMIAVLGNKKQWLRERLYAIMNKRPVTKKSAVALTALAICIVCIAVLSGGFLSGCAADVTESQKTAKPAVSASAVAAAETTPDATVSGTTNSEDNPEKIYSVDQDGNVIQIDLNEKRFIYGDSITTQLDDQAISKLVGLDITLPEALNDEYTLKDKSIGVSTGKRDAMTTLRDLDFKSAITDDTAFDKLSAFNPCRFCSATYQSLDGIVYISIYKEDRNNEDFESYYSEKNSVAVNIGTIKGSWKSFKTPIFPTKSLYGSETDNTKPPIKIDTHYCLMWTYNGMLYDLVSFNQFTQEKAVAFAKAFMEAQGN